MWFPTARLTNYIANSEPPIASSDINEIQDAIIRNWRAGYQDFFICEDFMNPITVDGTTGNYTYGDFGVTSVTTSDFSQDSATAVDGSAGIGTFRLAGAATGTIQLNTANIMIPGSKNFYLAMKVKRITSGIAGATFAAGLYNATAAAQIYHDGSLPTNWMYGQPDGSNTSSAVAVVNGTFVLVEIFRVGTTVTFQINGGNVSTVTFSTDRIFTPYMTYNISAGGTNGVRYYGIDFFKFWMPR